MKDILRQFSVARTPQQNRVVKRRNMTLIKTARTMLADSILPTTFWAGVVHTACYVQNKMLVVTPHNKTPYEPFHAKTPTLSFMRPSGCLVTILNTIDHLGKFDGKADEGFFAGYSMNSKAFRVFNSKTRIVEENLYISDDGKKVDEYPRKGNECNDQEKEDNVNSTNNVNTGSSIINTTGINRVNVVDENISIEFLFDPNMPAIEDVSTFDFSNNEFQRGKIDKTLFIKRHKDDILLMSYLGELTFFLGLKVKQKKDGTFISQDKYVAKILKKFGFTKVKTAKTPMETQKPLLKDEDGEECVPMLDTKVSHLHYVKRIFRKPKRKDTQVPQPSGPTESVADEAVYMELGDRLVRAATTASSLKASRTVRKPLTQAQARRNMIVYLKNMTGFKMDYFMGMIYDEIRPIFEKHYNYNQTFLDEVNKGVKVSKIEVRQEKDVEVESLKKEDATPLASMIPIVDYKIHTERNRPTSR
nr:ribonuclease H-like domain-containing protein [Tanacetum cinerariifolium]